MPGPREVSGGRGVHRSVWLAVFAGSTFVLDASAQSRGALETLMFAAAAADTIATEYAIEQMKDHPDFEVREVNPLLSNRAVRILSKTALTGAVFWTARKLEDGGHEKMAQVLRYASVAVWAGAAGWNVSLTVRY